MLTIIHSIVPIEEVLQLNKWEPTEGTKIIQWNMVKTEVKLIRDDIYEVQRIYSTNINDYLKPELQPGTRINIH